MGQRVLNLRGRPGAVGNEVAATATLPLMVRVLFTACVAMLTGNALVLIFNLETTESAHSNAEHERSATARSNLSKRVLADDAAAGPEYLGTAPVADRAPAVENMQYVDTLALHVPSHSDGEGQVRDDLESPSRSLVKVTQLHQTLSSRSYGRFRSMTQVGVVVNAAAIAVLIVFYLLIRRSFARQLRIDEMLKSHNLRLEGIVAQRTRELSELSRYLIRVAEEEKARLARDLHDELGANLTAMKLDMAYVASKLKGSAPPLAARLQRAIDTLGSAFHLKRRLVADLWPTMLDHLGLAAAVRAHCTEFTLRTNVAGVVDIVEDLTLEPGWAIALYRVVQESLTNVAKYAQASNVAVVLKRERQGLVLRVSDDGIGIPVGPVDTSGSYGVVGMRERISQLGGSFSISRRSKEGGTVVEAFIPLAPELRPSSERTNLAGVTLPSVVETLVH